ncbi:MAG TPA: DUF2254 domain-containing protein [Candidatus Limnocylindria bacterium]|nr:DUF2254 domain-containing protein [Candidatus Limnocylindria bacterium]
MPVRRILSQVRNSLWFVPGLWVVLAGTLAFGTLAVDSAAPELARSVELLFGGSPEGARSVLESIAGSMITVAGVVFSITIVALQLASSQLSPRVLRNFMRDRRSQSVLGALIGTFFYSLLVLRAIRTGGDGRDAFVPSLAVTVAIVLAAVAVAMLVFFIHHIARRIQVSTIVDSIATETLEAIGKEWRGDQDETSGAATAPPGLPGSVPATTSGYLQLVDTDGLLDTAAELDLVVRVEARPGDWVQAGTPLFAVWPMEAGGQRIHERLNQQVTLGAERSLEQDAGFGIRQLVDVAVKALSPGINDPTSARDCINRLAQLLIAIGQAPSRSASLSKDDRLRVILSLRDFGDLVDLAFDELRHYAGSTPAVAIALADALSTVRSQVDVGLRGPLERQARLLLECADEIRPDGDRERVAASVQRVLQP